ncbi:MAG: group II intron reverse transcriptase/maturase [Acidimicrobiia bacterium]|nr:group II intron reverse transcriptase/maturase [Acidimicrobiia bacterium]MDH5291412.1 group II intron reverse transcriptase/maturase [Acidimicrobiia bacterium]
MKSAKASSFTEAPLTGLDKVHALTHGLYQAAKQDDGRRFHSLYDKVSRRDVLWRAWASVAANGGAPGVDGVTISDVIDSGVPAFLEGLALQLQAKTYRPAPLRRVSIPKPGQPGKTRPLGIPVIADRVTMAAAKIILEPIFEADFRPVSFGFRPGLSAINALDVVRAEIGRGQMWVLDADVSDCFGQIDHDALMRLVEVRVSDRSMLRLIRAWLRVGVLEHGSVTATVSGTPQGSPISPLLANIALSVLDEEWERSARRIGSLIRYADDFVVVCATRDRAEAAHALAVSTLARVGLRLHPDKTSIRDIRDGDDGFDFLGFHHHMVPSHRQPGRRYLARWPSDRAMRSIRARLRELTDRRYVGLELAVIVKRMNLTLTGWGNYFKWGNSHDKFAHIDSYAHLRLAIWMSNKHDQRGRGWASRYNYAWCRSTGLKRVATMRPVPAHATR